METIFEILVWLFVEVVIPFLGEALAEWGFYAIGEKRGRRPAPVLAMMGSLLLGLAFGALSVWLLPEAMLKQPNLRLANLAIMPVVVGLVMAQIGRWREATGRGGLIMSRFSNAYLLALGIALVRYFGTH
jgi:hypothetical protein